MKNLEFPSLAFGSMRAHIDTSEYAMQERLKLLENGSHTYESLGNPNKFINHSFFTSINGLKIGSTATTPIRVGLKRVNTPMLIIPLAGEGIYQMGGEVVSWRARDKAVLIPSEDFTGESTLRSSLAIFIDPNRLEATFRSMLGLEIQGSNFMDLCRPQEVAMQYGNISFDAVFRKLTEAVDLLSSEPGLLNLSGLDDGIYRAMAMMLRPDLFKIGGNSRCNQSYSEKLLDRACQYIQENKHQLITLSDLERVSCMTSRNLQYAFQHRFKCSPMHWLRVQRLETARSMLLKADSTLTVTSVALFCGFNSSSTFSNYYRLRFGELPSVTMKRSQ